MQKDNSSRPDEAKLKIKQVMKICSLFEPFLVI